MAVLQIIVMYVLRVLPMENCVKLVMLNKWKITSGNLMNVFVCRNIMRHRTEYTQQNSGYCECLRIIKLQ